MEDDEDIFSIEGESQGRTVIHHVGTQHEEFSSDSEESADAPIGLSVVAEYEVTDLTDKESSFKRQEEELLTAIDETTSTNHQTKLQMELATLYQENGFFEKAVQSFQTVVQKLEKSIHHEDRYHYALRCLSVCLREIGRNDEALNLLNKDVDVLVFRKTRSAGGGEYRQYYDCELQRSYEELGNTYMT